VKTIHLDPDAVDEMEEAAVWYDQRQSGAGRLFLAEVERVRQAIVERPTSHPRVEVPSGDLVIRRALLTKFPYAIVFLDREAYVLVLAVAHTKRRPSYWLNRLRYV
jgi:toxin ParE1/3/4